MFSSCILVPKFAVLEQVEYTCIVGFEHEDLDCVYVVFLSWKTGKKKSSLHVNFLL